MDAGRAEIGVGMRQISFKTAGIRGPEALVLEVWYASPEAMKRVDFLSALTSYLVEEIQIAG